MLSSQPQTLLIACLVSSAKTSHHQNVILDARVLLRLNNDIWNVTTVQECMSDAAKMTRLLVITTNYIGSPYETVLRSRGRDSPTNQMMTRRTKNVSATEFRFILDLFVDNYC